MIRNPFVAIPEHGFVIDSVTGVFIFAWRVPFPQLLIGGGFQWRIRLLVGSIIEFLAVGLDEVLIARLRTIMQVVDAATIPAGHRRGVRIP